MAEEIVITDDDYLDFGVEVPKDTKGKKDLIPPLLSFSVPPFLQPLIADVTHDIARTISGDVVRFEMDRKKTERVLEKKFWKTINLRSKSYQRSK